MNDKPQITPEFIQELQRRLVDEGKLIEAGWVSLHLTWMPEAPQYQIDDMRNAFFAGAQYLFSSILTILEPDAEPTQKDLGRMDLIDRELGEFLQEFQIKFMPTKGSG